MGLTVFREPSRLNMGRIKQVTGTEIRRSDFRILRTHKDKRDFFFQEGSPVRQRLTVNLGAYPQNLTLGSIQNKISKLINAMPEADIAQTDNAVEAAQVMAELMKAGVKAEFLAVRKPSDKKIHIIKGKEGTKLVPLQQFSIPFIPRNPIIHIHPLGAEPMPSIQDYEYLMRNGIPFGIALGYGHGLKTAGITLSKFYMLGPFRTIDTRFVKPESTYDAIIHALTKDSGFSRAIYYLLSDNPDRRIGHSEMETPYILDQYKRDMREYAGKIASYEQKFYPDPVERCKNPQTGKIIPKKQEQLMELIRIYIATQHFFNAVLLLEKLNLHNPSEELNMLFRAAYNGMHDTTLEDVRKNLDVEGA